MGFFIDCFFIIWQNVEPTHFGKFFYSFGQNFAVVKGQISKLQSGHLVTLSPTQTPRAWCQVQTTEKFSDSIYFKWKKKRRWEIPLREKNPVIGQRAHNLKKCCTYLSLWSKICPASFSLSLSVCLYVCLYFYLFLPVNVPCLSTAQFPYRVVELYTVVQRGLLYWFITEWIVTCSWHF